jgi:SnoaL-like protein
MTLEERVCQLEARVAIMDLLGRYAAGVASRNREQIVACFTADGVMDVGPTQVKGPEEMRAYLEDLKPGSAHLSGFDQATTSTPVPANVLIEVDGHRARATSMSVVFHAGSHKGIPVVMVRGTEYEDEFACPDGEWLFTLRRHRTVWEFKVDGVDPTAPPRWRR